MAVADRDVGAGIDAHPRAWSVGGVQTIDGQVLAERDQNVVAVVGAVYGGLDIRVATLRVDCDGAGGAADNTLSGEPTVRAVGHVHDVAGMHQRQCLANLAAGVGCGTGVRITTGRRDVITGTRRPATGGGSHEACVEE